MTAIDTVSREHRPERQNEKNMNSNVKNELWGRRNVLRAMGGVATLIATGTLAACGGASAQVKTVRMKDDMKFEPSSLTIKTGDTVTWKSDDDSAMVHTATADPDKVRDKTQIELPPGAAPWDSGNVAQGKEWSYTFDTPGRYKYVCLPHLIAGMVGEIVVEE